LAYRAKLRAIVFAIRDCGFQARCALEESDSGEVRLHKILRLQKECRYDYLLLVLEWLRKNAPTAN
jgi:hypothetical protein